jgi:uncharacterized protein with FMN-binding domain
MVKNKRRRVVIIAAAVVIVLVTGLGIVYGQIESGLRELADMPIIDIDLSEIRDGTYTGSFSVFPVMAEVEVITADHKIESIKILRHRNGQGKAAEAIIYDVIKEQDLDVETVTGATYSSMVILKAIENALDKAD